MTKKITKEMQFNAIKEILEAQEQYALAEFIQNEIELVRKKNSRKSTGKPSKNAVENERLGQIVLEAMAPDEAYTVSELQNKVPELKELSNQRATSVIGALKDAGKVKREVIKGKAYFSVI